MRSHSCAVIEAGQQIVGKDALGAFFAAVDGEGDALGEEGEIGRLLAALQFFGGQAGKGFGQGAIVRPKVTVGAARISSKAWSSG